MWQRILFIILQCYGCFLSSNISLSAQGPVNTENFTVLQGLSENVIHSLFQDRKGFLWIGTHEGLNRYDGYAFKKYRHDKDDSTSLPNSPIEDIYEDESGDFWLFGNSRITRMNTLLGKFTPQPRRLRNFVLESSGFTQPPRQIDNYQVDNFWRYYDQNENGNKYLLTALQKTFFGDPSTLALYYDKNNNLWVLQKDQLLVVDNKNNRRMILTGFTLKHTVSRSFNWLINDRNGNMWLRADNKMYCINKKTYSVDAIVEQDQLEDLPLENINTVLLDRTGILWIGSFYGLKKLNLSRKKFNHFNEGKEGKGLVSNFVLGLTLHDGNKLSVQHYFLDSFYTEIDLADRSISHREINLDNPGRFVQDVLLRNEHAVSNTIWKYQLLKINRLSFNWKLFRYGYTDRTGVIWSFHNPGILINFHDSRTIQLWEGAEYIWDDKDFLWVATTRRGLIRLNKSSSEVKSYNANKNNPNAISVNDLLCLLPDQNENLWIGTRGGGLNYFDKKTERFINYNESDGLCNNSIYCMVADKDNNLWLGTANGLSYFNTLTKTFKNFYTSDGLSNTEFNRWSAVRDSKGNLYFGGMNGIDYFDPREVLNQEANIPVVHLTDFKTGNLSRPLQPGIKLNHKDNFISFEFAAMDFRNPSATQYEYMLEGANNDWIRVEHNRTVTFSGLPPGDYKFRVRSASQTGQWSEDTFLPFTIKAPWWRTTWFYGICGLLIIGILYSVYKFRINQLQKLYSVRNRISQDLHDEVGATLSSIHVYSSVASKAMQADNEKARDALKQINVNTRQVMENMNDIVWAMHTGNKGEISFESKLKNYGYDLLTPLNISCAYHIDRDAERLLTNIEARKNMLLIAKEAINNIAKHSKATAAAVYLKISGKQLELEILDNGKGINNGSRKTGNGLQNMQSRAKSLEGSFEIGESSEGGLAIRCRVPITSIRD